MRGRSRFRPMLVVTLISLFMIITIPLSMARESGVEEKAVDTRTTSDLFHIMGPMGQNGWYIGTVSITIHPPELGPVYYRIDNGDWTQYSTPIIIDSDGVHTLYCYYIIDGNQSEIFSISFKIDKTPPFVNISFHREGCRILISVNGLDNTSGVVSVEFYQDGALIGNVTVPPFEFELSIGLFGEHTVGVIVYDAAGNSAEASHTFPYDYLYSFPHQKSIFHLQYVLTVSWDDTPIRTPLLNGETRKINFTLKYGVTRGAYGKFLLRLLEGRPFTIHLSVENTPDWCDAWFTLVNVSGIVLYDDEVHANTSLSIHVYDDAPGNDTQGWVMASASVECMKGPFHLLTLIHGFKQDFTIAFLNGS